MKRRELRELVEAQVNIRLLQDSLQNLQGRVRQLEELALALGGRVQRAEKGLEGKAEKEATP